MCYNLAESLRQYRYPIGVQSFRKMIEGNYRYVDKTEYIYKMEELSSYIFLSRPRRFGKSLLSSTIEAYFAGEEELFKGLKAHDLKRDWTPHPVLHFDMSSLKNLTNEELSEQLFVYLKEYEKQWGVECDHISTGSCLEGLIKQLYQQTGQKVVLIIDEYDAPLLNAIDELTLMKSLRTEMQKFYSPIKKCDPYLEFVFITGITKFAQLSIFSELNNLLNISMVDEFSGICGISKEELTTQFRPDVERLAQVLNKSYEEMLAILKANYDGYHFSENPVDIFNPFSLIKAFALCKIGSYWYESGTPTVLVKLGKLFAFDVDKVDGEKVSANEFNVAMTEMQTALPVLYQSGYLTIKKYDEDLMEYTLAYPNKEVRLGMIQSYAPSYLNKLSENNSFIRQFYVALRDDNLDAAFRLMQSFVAKILYLLDNRNERHYQTIFYMIFNLLSELTESEVMMATGRIDAVVKTRNAIFVVEMKYDHPIEEAFGQIEAKDYTLPYLNDPRKLYRVGLTVNSEKHNFDAWEVEQVKA